MVRRRVDEPNMSDNLLLVKVEDLINMAMGPADKNVVNFKLVQMVLHILARNLRMLETQVEIRISEADELREHKREEESTESSKSPGSSARGRVHMEGIEEHEEHGGKKDKHRHKAGRESSKDKEERAASKEREKSAKEHEKADKAAAKEREKAEKKEQKEKEKAEKAAAKAERDAAKGTKEKGRGRKGSGTSIAISEQERHKEKVLVVEKGPTTRTDSHTRVGSIEVVTVSQFELLESAVNHLKTLTGPLPSPEFPDNKKLMEDIANGTASLTDIMQAMQVTARIKAAEQAIGRMADLLTQLAAAGAIPEELVEMVEEVRAEVDEVAAAAGMEGEEGEEMSMRSRPSAGRKSVAIEAMSSRSTARRDIDAGSVKHAGSETSSASKMVPMPPVSHREMDDALHALKEDLSKAITLMTGKATTAAENASTTARGVAEKLDVAVKLNSRISTLYSLVNDYADQLNGFDTGLTTQMTGFKDQMSQMRSELKAGMAQLSQAGGNSETAAVMELTERYDLLVVELDAVLHEHQALSSFQKQLGDELHSLVECVEMLREQKADRDEVQDGLRDKADISRLAGLLTEKVFASSRGELERRLELCHDKFRKQELVWMGAIKDLMQITESKAELMQLMAARDDAQLQLRDLHHKLHRLADILGEPTAAMLTRKLARDATCGACMVPALMSPWDANYGSPPPLPALRPRPTGAEQEPEEPCLRDFEPPPPPDAKAHTCLRWVGGSHTLVSEMVTKEKAPPMDLQGHPTKRYTGYGSDGRLYMLEEELQPCVECNIIFEAPKPEGVGDVTKDGAGDRGATLIAPDKK
ncbi:plectin [Manduca sexta]|uniref:plectin n=1 Tax=Manduca sexta TaxID=7130 RepID=UPI00188FBDCC|nr:plectin [Manduca sexta]